MQNVEFIQMFFFYLLCVFMDLNYFKVADLKMSECSKHANHKFNIEPKLRI